MSRVAGVLLAAGSASRFGGPKLLQPLADGTPVGVAAARRLASALPHSVAVVRPGDTTLAERLAEAGLAVVVNPRAGAGMGASLAAGVQACPRAAGWIVALADMPWVAAATLTGLVRQLEAGASLVAPEHAGRRGNPVGFAARWRTVLCALDGDIGGRQLLERHAEELIMMPTQDAGVLADVDEPSDLGRRPGGG